MMTLSRCLNVNVIGYDYSGYGDSTGKWALVVCPKNIDSTLLDSSRRDSPKYIMVRTTDAIPSCRFECFAGTPSEEDCYADIEAVFEHLINERKVPSEHIILFGRSLGSGLAGASRPESPVPETSLKLSPSGARIP